MSEPPTAEGSFLEKHLKGWSFRSTTPTFEPGERIELFLTGVRDGDAVIHIPDAPREMVDSRVAVRVAEFDSSAYTGTGEFVETVGESAF